MYHNLSLYSNYLPVLEVIVPRFVKRHREPPKILNAIWHPFHSSPLVHTSNSKGLMNLIRMIPQHTWSNHMSPWPVDPRYAAHCHERNAVLTHQILITAINIYYISDPSGQKNEYGKRWNSFWESQKFKVIHNKLYFLKVVRVSFPVPSSASFPCLLFV